MILTSGCFDGLHAGHVRALERAKALDPERLLIVAMAPDAYILATKRRAPRFSLEDRLATVQALRCVDQVIAHDAQGVASTIRAIAPTLFVKGLDWDAHLPQDVQDACHDVGAPMLFLDSGSRLHTSRA